MRYSLVKLSVLLLLIFAVTESCNKNDLAVNPNNPTEQAFFQSESDFTKAIIGTYAKLTDFYWYNGSQNACLIPVTYLPGDDVTPITSDEEFETFATLNPSSGRLSYMFASTYQLIGRANVILQKIAAVKSGIYTTPNLKNYHQGEAYFLRGYANYLLWNVWGTAPVVTERLTTLGQLNPPSSTGTQLLDQAISDFTNAAALLPTAWDANNAGRATSNAANGFLGKCLVFRGTVTKNQGDFTAAITAFNKITGVSLVAKFDDNFAADTENNTESLFEFQASSPAFDNVWLGNDFSQAVGSSSVFWGFFNNNFALFGKPIFVGTAKLDAIFDPNDPRRALTINTTSGNREIKKYVTRNNTVGSGVGSSNNPRILRYADVLLLKAEAIIQSGGTAADAIALINQVRTRARNYPGNNTGAPANRDATVTDKTTILKWIMDERLMELAAEGQRWFDIRRWVLGGLLTIDNSYFSSNSPQLMSYSAKNLYFPIPLSETDKNPNVKQNPGY